MFYVLDLLQWFKIAKNQTILKTVCKKQSIINNSQKWKFLQALANNCSRYCKNGIKYNIFKDKKPFQKM